MYNWDYIEQEICKIVLNHTTKFDCDDLAEFSNAIIDAWLTGISIEDIISNEKPADEDKENLIKAAVQIDLAIKSIEKIGYLGTLALRKQMPEDLLVPLAAVSEQIKAAANMLDSSDRGLIAILSGVDDNPDKQRGRKHNLVAFNVTSACADVFEAGTNYKATLTRNAYAKDPLKDGKFHQFLTEIFDFLEIRANVEYCIKGLSLEKKAK